MYNSTSFRKGISLVTLTAFVFSLFSPFANVAFAGTPDAAVTYSSDPAGTWSLTISIETNEALAPGATISIDQPGTVDIVDDTLTDLGSGTGFTYIYTVNADDGSNYVDGTAIVTLSGVSVSTWDPINIVSWGSFTITTLPPLDTEAPVVTLSGSDTSVEYGTDYTELGASWTDNIDGTGDTFVGIYGQTGSFAVSWSVNTGALWTYTLEYLKVDSSNNSSGTTRTVTVEDTIAPVVTLSGSPSMSIIVNTSFVDDGASWTDLPTNDSGSILVATSGSVITTQTGTYLLEYTYIDGAGNGDTEIRTVIVSSAPDTTPPTVNLYGTGIQYVELGTNYIESGAIWTDNIDGTGDTFVGIYGQTGSFAVSWSVNTGALWTYTLEYLKVDSSNNSSGTTRTVTVEDTTDPTVVLSGSAIVNIFSGGVFIDDGATYSDADIWGGFIWTYNSGTLDVNNSGTYIIGYEIADASGNTGSITRTVNVSPAPDTTPPVISLIWSGSMSIAHGSVYVDSGATALDDTDGDITANIMTGGLVNTSLTGTYILTYDVSDAAMNAATQVTRTVNVVDNTAPIVTPVDGSFITLTQGDSYTESGASWTDNVDGTGFLAVPYTGSVDTNTVGSYLVEYRYTDGAGNVGMWFRTVTVNDTTPPVITLSGSATVNVEYGSSFVDDGASWTDNVDGSGVISGYTSGSVNTGTLGTYIVSYEYTDGAGNMGTGVSRTVIVEDTIDPVVTLSGAATVNVVVGDTYTESGAYWTDVDGVYGTILTASSGTVDTNSTGTYLLDYIHADSSGNTGSVTRTVQVLSGPDLTPPVITLSGSSPITVEQGSLYTDDGATAIDDIDGDITVSINTVNPVNTALTGTYIVTYDVTDAGGNPATQVTRTVNVVDTIVPTISLLWVSSVDVEYGSSFVDDGAEWDDGFNGTGMISGYNSGSLDVNTLGTYTIWYEYADLSGNVGIGATRSVNVVDTTAPVLSPIGWSPVSLVVGDSYTESGASWTDIHDGTGVVMTPFSGSVDTNTIGSYLLEYEYADISGNTGATSRTVNVLSAPDTTPPVITLFGSAALNVEIGSSYTELGASWTDNVDGSGTISTPTIGSVNIGSIGTYVLGYSYTDGAGNLGSVNRTVNVVDTISPTASVTYSTLSTTSGSVTATLTWASESIVITNNGGSPTYTFTTNGSFTFTFQDMTGGNTGSTVANVANIDTTAPVITLLGVSPTTVSQWSTYVDMGVIATDNVDGTITPSVTVSGSVTTATIGSYTLTYNVSDSVGNTATPVSRIVNVIVAAPIVTAPAVGAGGGGGGGSASTAVSPLVSSNPNGQTALQNQNMTLGITALERILREQKANRETQASETVEGISPVESISIVVNDIANSESRDAITTLIEKGYVKNTKKFDPKRAMTRAEFVKVLSLAYGFEDMWEGEASFTDMRGSEFQKYVEFWVIMGWINPDMKKFRPNDAITLGEALKLLDAAQGTWDAHAPVINKEILSREDAAALIVEEMEVE